MRRTPRTALAALGLASAFALTGCFANPLDGLVENVVGGGVENLIENELGGDVDVNIPGSGGTSTLPSSWPSDVPTPDGDVIFSLGTPGNWAATIIVANAGVVDAIYGDLEGAGYTLISEADFGGLASRVYENDVYNVSVSGTPSEDGTSTVTVQYIIAEKEPQG